MDEEELDPDQAKFAEFARKVFAYEPSVFSRVCLTGFKDGKGVFDRTGILLRIASRPFLLTAKHNLPEILSAGYKLAVPPPHESGQLVPVEFTEALMSSEEGTDHAVFGLVPEAASQLEAQGYRFLGIQHLQSATANRGPHCAYHVAGYPTALEGQGQEGVRTIEHYNWLTYRWDVANGNDSRALPGTRSPNELLLAYPKDAVHTAGPIREPPKPHGMSGCGVWFVRDFGSTLLWNPSEIRLVAIQSSWFEKPRCLKALPIDVALGMIWRQYPDTRNSLISAGFEF